jgi:hypothetical protein
MGGYSRKPESSRPAWATKRESVSRKKRKKKERKKNKKKIRKKKKLKIDYHMIRIHCFGYSMQRK